MTECYKCGRSGGHHLGCPEALREHARNLVAPDFSGELCAREGCTNPRAPQGKGPRPKYCQEHKTGSK